MLTMAAHTHHQPLGWLSQRGESEPALAKVMMAEAWPTTHSLYTSKSQQCDLSATEVLRILPLAC